jgi:alcohol dehydrogenase (cytochrome c)
MHERRCVVVIVPAFRRGKRAKIPPERTPGAGHYATGRGVIMKTKAFAGALVSSLLMATALTPARAADMTNDRALNPQREPQNWILHHGNYQGHRFSLLKEINTDTVKNLKPAFTVALSGFQNGGRYAHGNLEATPLIEDGIMYVPDGWGSVYAIDLTAGKKGVIKWKMDPGTDRAWAGDVACCGVNNRGVALWKDKVISIALDGRMFSINKASGEVVWERKIAEPAIGETLTIAPLIVRDFAIVGTAGGERGIRGFIEATDLNTGKAAWRTYTIPGAGEPGSETWKDGKERWKHGGGSVWETATYDPESDTFYQGIGNPGPDWDAEYRPGDNKWAGSVLAVSPTDGKIKWGYQYTPNDPYDFDEISEHPIINAKVNGEDRKLVVHAARNGFFYTLDRTNGSFIAGKQYVDQLNWTPGLDPKTGKPLNYNPNADVQIYAERTRGTRAKPKSEKLCPTNNGGKNWEPSAYNPELGLIYIPSIEGCNYIELIEQQDMVDQGGTIKPRERFTGGAVRTPDRLYGSLKAVDPTTGETKAAQKLIYPNMAGVLATAGNLVFLGHYDGTFAAYDAKTLKEVWSFNVGSPIQAPPVSYSVNGKQYVAILVGARMWPFIVENAPELKNQATASMLYVFSL